MTETIHQMLARQDREKKRRIAMSPDAATAAGAIGWLRARLAEQDLAAGDDFRRVEVQSQITMLDLHPPVAVSERGQQIYECRAKCAGESWTCYGDGEDVVASPCLHVKLIARAYAGHPNFPKPLRLDEEG